VSAPRAGERDQGRSLSLDSARASRDPGPGAVRCRGAGPSDAARNTPSAESPQAPERGRLARLLGPLHVTGVFWYRFHLWGVRHGPRWAFSPCVHLFTCFFAIALRRIRRAIKANLAAVLGPAGFLEAERRVWRTLLTFAWCLTERYEHLAGRRSPQLEVDHREAWDRLVAARRGFIVLTAHLGNWEAAAAVAVAHLDSRMHLVREEELDPEAQRFVRQLVAGRMGPGFVTHFAGDPSLGLLLGDALGRGEVVALQGDRPRAGGQAIATALFGRPFLLPAGPLALARVSAAPLLPAFAFREGRGRYRVVFRDPIQVATTDDRKRDLEHAAWELTRVLEWAIARAPHQWFCFRRLWPEPQRAATALAPHSPQSGPT